MSNHETYESTVGNLKILTKEFFDKHWNYDLLDDSPGWSDKYTFEGSLPNYDKQGVYAFVKGDVVTYIGVGTSRGNDKYRGHGLGKRFQSYSKVIDGSHMPTDERLIDAGAMMTIGFDSKYAYIANALELFLISNLNPIHNVNKPGS